MVDGEEESTDTHVGMVLSMARRAREQAADLFVGGTCAVNGICGLYCCSELGLRLLISEKKTCLVHLCHHVAA